MARETAINNEMAEISGQVSGGSNNAGVSSASLTGKNAFCRARSENAPVMTMPTATTGTNHGEDCQSPMATEISATKPLKPGRPIDAAVASVNAIAAPGRVRHRSNSRSAVRSRVWVRSYTTRPAIPKSSPAMMPWEIICNTAPRRPQWVPAAIPNRTNPMWLTLE